MTASRFVVREYHDGHCSTILAVSIPYEAGGRIRQKNRTRQSLVEAARELVAAGQEPSVEQAAERAGVSRTTAYRYFTNQRMLVVAAHPETAATSLLPSDAPADLAGRLDVVITRFIGLIIETESAQRAMLRLSLNPDPVGRGSLPLRRGRAIGWIAEALEPLRDRLTEPELHRLVLAVRSATGVEALVWLTDIAGLSRAAAAESMRWSAQALLAAALTSGPPPAPPRRRGRTAARTVDRP
jgi:AcrR family transcriptional regulator